MKTVGIIGFGIFGRFMAAQLSPHVTVLVDEARVSAAAAAAVGARRASWRKVAEADVVIPSVPVQVLESVLRELATAVRPGSLVADVSSVKVIPVELMRELLPPGVDILATHPLFGPQSGANGIAGLPMVVWPVRLRDGRFAQVKQFLSGTLQLSVQEIAPDEHDREMAYVQAMTFLLGKAFSDMDIPDTPLKTKTYQHLLDVRRIVENDSPELFATIQQYNPFAAPMRLKLVQQLEDLERGLESEAGK